MVIMDSDFHGNKRKSKLLQRRTGAADFLESIKQGNAGTTPARMQEIHIAEEFLKSLPELAYHVTKINQWGKHQQRTVRLTSEGVENVRGTVVSSMHQYGVVQSVCLRNLNTFVIQYLHAEHDYVYRSPVAIQIVHEISTRVALYRSKDKKKTSSNLGFDFTLVDTPTSTASSISIPSVNTDSSDISFSSDLSSASSARSSVSSTSSSSSFSSFPSSPSLSLESSASDKRAAKLTKVLGTPQETRLHAEVDKLLWNEATPEGRTVQQFVSDFHVVARSPASCLTNVRLFLNSMRSHIVDTRGPALIKLVVNSAPDLTPEQTLSLIVERSLEQAVVGRLHKPIFSTVTSLYKISDEQLSMVTSQLKGKNQAFFGIPDDIESTSSWSPARLEFRQMLQADTPSNKLAVILATAKSIYSTANYEQSVVKKKTCVLSADDFLPIFIFVVIQSEVGSLESTNQFLWQLCDPTQFSGESGYYLTVFSSIISLLHRVHIPSLETATTLEDAIPEEDSEFMNDTPNNNETPQEDDSGKWHRKVKFWK